MKTKPPNHPDDKGWLINFVSQDYLKSERIRAYSKKIKGYRVIISDFPLGELDIDATVLPVEMIFRLSAAQREEYPLPAIVYGSPLLLKKAFLAGAFDYLKSPWSPEELFLRMDRFTERLAESYRLANMELRGNSLRSDNGEILLSCQESRVLKALLKQKGEPVSRKVLFYALWGKIPVGNSRIIDVHISTLRKKILSLDSGTLNSSPITAVRGIGYMISL